MRSSPIVFALLVFTFATCMALTAQAQQLSIMTFNVENLFDTVDDAGKDDETYLPIEQKSSPRHIDKCNAIDVIYWREQCLYWDWSTAVAEQKLLAVGRVIKQVNSGQGPDIIALQEVENRAILERLREEQLTGLGYQPAVLLEGNDSRGIDVAFLSKLPVREVSLHDITFSESEQERIGDTRPILQATFELNSGELITGFSVHFPAPYHPTRMRDSAYTTLNTLLAQLPPGQLAFAAGDFNTTSEENNEQEMLEKWVRPLWEVAHDLCEDCPGTSYYAPTDEWSFLDMLLWRPGDNWQLTSSYLANAIPEQVTEEGTPRRFSMPGARGVSDHWPLVMEIEPRP